MPILRLLVLTAVFAMAVVACSSGSEPSVRADDDGDEQVVRADTGTDAETEAATTAEPEVLAITPTVPVRPVDPEVQAPSLDREIVPQNSVPLVIFDTDMGPDIDDALALAMLHGYQKQGMVELAAVTISRKSQPGAKYSDAINTFFGRPDVPIGLYYGDIDYFYDDRLSYVSTADEWPNDVVQSPLDPGYVVQRRVLVEAAATGRSVVIIQTGFSGNLSDLVESGGDEISDKTGVELIQESVSVLSLMAGAFDRDMSEFNVEKDIVSARKVFEKWPGPMAVSPFELGNAIHYPYSSIVSDFGWVERHPIRTAYEFSDLGWHRDAPPFYDMKSWDLTSVIEAVEPDGGYFLRTGTGTVTVDRSGRTTFTEGDGQHYVLDRAEQYGQEQRQRVIDRMIQLTSATP